MNGARTPVVLLLVSVLSSQGCSDREPDGADFRLLDPEATGITFANTIPADEARDFNRHVFTYNGAGVAVGDVNGDDLPDIYLTGNTVTSRLYLNRGDMRFEDVTEAAGVTTDRWATGASMVDIDGDGDLDIHVSVSGREDTTPDERRNLLFVNDGDGTFTEVAAAYGIDDSGYTTHAAFLDYDRDGDLDLFLLANSPGEFRRGETGRTDFGANASDPSGFDQLYRNNGDGTFSNVSGEAGILRQLGYGLGVVVADLNRDGWPDIYVSNDITPNDVLYVNNGDGTFTDRAAEWLGHTSFAGMGVDIADFTNNGWPGILQSDMMPVDPASRKRVSGTTTYDAFATLLRQGFYPQYNFNTLQLNHGVTDDGKVIFSEIAGLAGVARTEWSWSALFADYDNDGFKDMLITNGYPKAVIDLDYQANLQRAARIWDARMREQLTRDILDELHAYHVANFIFRNDGGLTFTDMTRSWGLDRPGFSYGAAYADLNNDGSLDLVINNIDAPASVYQNVPTEEGRNRFLRVLLEGESPNSRGLGAKVMLTSAGEKQYIDHSPYRGFMSTMDERVHFGLGQADRVDSLEVIWPDGRYQLLRDIGVDQAITIAQRDAMVRVSPDSLRPPTPERIFDPVEGDRRPTYEHHAIDYRTDYTLQPLLPYQISRQGPPVAVADVDGNGLEDVFIGAGAGTPGTLFLQQEDGRFIASPDPQPWAADADHEDWGALFFDADGNGTPDLYVASGGYHVAPTSRLLQDRLYTSQGDGRFVKSREALPEMLTSTASVEAGDMNRDGLLDLFVGGSLVPGDYPAPARSYILRNEGGRFTDVTAEVAPSLVDPGGMVTDGSWTDFNGDGRLDLVTVGIWMPVQFLENDGTRLRDVTASIALPPLRGWWYSLETGDFDNDGDTDLVAGNLGLNHAYTTSEKSTFGVYAADFNGNRIRDIIFTEEIDGTEYPYYGLALLGREFDALGLTFQTYASFASATVGQAFGEARLDEALHYQVDTFASVQLLNDGNGRFTVTELPRMAQISPILDVIAHDVDEDGNLDLIVGGNLYETEPNVPRADAGKGLWLRGNGRGGFRAISPYESGFLAPLDVRGLALVRSPAGRMILVANHGDTLQAFQIRGIRE